MPVILGIDVGIASIGFALVDDQAPGIIACGVHLFDSAENPKDGSSLAAPRRIARLQRRRLRRRRQRRNAIHRLLTDHGFNCIDQLKSTLGGRVFEKTPWQLRAEGLHRLLDQDELARVLLHINKRRGFQSTRKIQTGEDDEGKVMLEGAKALRQAMADAHVETIGAYLATLDKKRNEQGSYGRTVLRDLLRNEAQLLFQCQREFGHPLATEELEASYMGLAFYQRPLQSTLELVGYCRFEDGEKRAPKFSLSAELFIVLSRLANLRIITRRGNQRTLTEEERKFLLSEGYQRKGGITYGQARKLLGLSAEESFNISYRKIKPEDDTWEAIRDRAEKDYLVQFKGWQMVKKALEDTSEPDWTKISEDRPSFDKVMEALTYYEDEQDIRPLLKDLGLGDPSIAALLKLNPKGTINLSLKALANILPHMEDGQDYTSACQSAGYHHSQRANRGLQKLTPFESTRNPVVDRALAQSRKVINAIINRHGMPDYFHVEMARELGKPLKERRSQERENKTFQAHKQELAEHAKELFGHEVKGQEFMKYRLWKEQGGRCVYSGVTITPAMLKDSMATQIDHALPFSRSWDNSYSNKVLSLSDENQRKANKTPYEYLEPIGRWDEFCERIKSLPRAKVRRLLTRNFEDEVQNQWKERNLTDTRYIARHLKNHLAEQLKPNHGVVNLARTRNGAITSMLRGMWGLGLKDRSENARHHALDAIILACTTESMVKKVATWNRHSPDQELAQMPKPWAGFRHNALDAVDKVFVSRQPVRKVTGQAHQETIKSLRKDQNGNDAVVARMRLSGLEYKKLKTLVGIDELTEDGQAVGRNKRLYDTLKARLDAYGGDPKKAFAQPIHMPTNSGQQGPVIRRVKVWTTDKSCIPIPGRNGVADNGRMVRTDVFSREGKYYICPVYVHQVATKNIPNHVCKSGKPEDQWPTIDDSYRFLFSLYKNDYVVAIKPNMEVVQGYYSTMDRGSVRIELLPHDAPSGQKPFKVSVLSLKSLRKFTISPLGEISEIKQEKRLGLENGATAKPNEVEP